MPLLSTAARCSTRCEILGRGFTQGEVTRIDRAIDRALGLAGRSAQRKLGALSERYESGGRGAGTVSGGQGDPGGVSYGTYQLASRTGTAAKFVASEGKPWARELRDAPGSSGFSAAWREIAVNNEPEAFGEAQHAFIKRTHYDPVVKAVRAKTGVDLDGFPHALRDVVWSLAVQHGGAARIIQSAIAKAGAGDAGALIEAIYAERTAYVLRVAGRSGRAGRRTLESVTRNRYPAELRDALAMLDADQ
ncbi:MAG: hypothetical protein R3D89_09900 [Sphingomonadaceae bacterium]